MTFQRARTEEQREQRRATILAVASQMLAEMPVAKLSLNELSRRVGLAKSNVLRYFDSREAVLLELLDTESRAWAQQAAIALAALRGAVPQERPHAVANTLATTLTARPVLCDLLQAESAVLERNVSPEVVLRHKRATLDMAGVLTTGLCTALPDFNADQALEIIMATLLITAAAWPYATPAEALKAAYESDPVVAAMHRDFTPLVARNLELLIKGLHAELTT